MKPLRPNALKFLTHIILAIGGVLWYTFHEISASMKALSWGMAWFAAHFRIELRTLEEIKQTNGFLCTFLLENSTFKIWKTISKYRGSLAHVVFRSCKKIGLAKFFRGEFNTRRRSPHWHEKKNANLKRHLGHNICFIKIRS